MFLLPGVRFDPTDVMLVMYYLKRKIMGRRFPFEAISEIDLYSFAPWDLPGLSCLKTKDRVWFFFCSLDRKYATGQRAKRTTDVGFWKTTGKDLPIFLGNRLVGYRKSLVFHRGKGKRGYRTDWVMHEYRLEDNDWTDASISQDSFVLCKIKEKSGRGPKNGEQYGAPFREEDWDDDGGGVDEENDSLIHLPCACTSSSLARPGAEQNKSMMSSALESGNGYKPVVEPLPQSVTLAVTELQPSSTEHDDVRELLLNSADEDVDTSTPNGSGIVEVNPNKITVKDADNPEIFDGLEDITSPIRLKSTKLDFLRHLEAEGIPCQMLSPGEEPFLELNDLQDPMEVEEPFLEFKDLCYPMAASGSEYERSDCLSGHHSTIVLPALGVQTRGILGGNWECWEPRCGSSAISDMNREEESAAEQLLIVEPWQDCSRGEEYLQHEVQRLPLEEELQLQSISGKSSKEGM